MRNLAFLMLGLLLILGSIYLFLQKPAPEKYVKLVKPEVNKIVEEEPVSILFVGDIMLDRAIRIRINERGFDYLFDDINSIFQNNDLVIGNLEGTITSNNSIAISNNQIFRFTFATSTTASLKNVGFSGFNLANNHTLDFYQAGFEETKKNLGKVELFSFGHPLNNQSLSYKTGIKSENICFVGYHSLYSTSTVSVINEIKNIKPVCSYLVVFAHWGAEYEDFESEEDRVFAHSFIDNGADLIIGSHPHVIQPLEIYKNRAIFYSLGNFIFDQDFSLRTRQGIAVRLILENDKQTFEIIPIEMFKGHLYFPKEESFQPRMDILISKLSDSLKPNINITKEFTLIK